MLSCSNLLLPILTSTLVHAVTPANEPSVTLIPKNKGAVTKSAEAKPATIKFNYKNTDINRVIEDYAKVSGQRFIVDGVVKGRITVFNPTPISVEEAFNQLSESLASNSLAISSRDEVMFVSTARSVQRDLIPVVTELPPVRPDRMVTLVINLKHVSAEEVNRQLRILASKDGELITFTPNNQLLVSDWTPNLHRIADIVKALDVPSDNPTPPEPPPALVEPTGEAKESEPALVPPIPRMKPAPPPKKKD